MASSASSPAPALASAQLGFRLGASALVLEIGDEPALALISQAYAPMLCAAAEGGVHASLRRLSDGRLHVRYGRQALRPSSAADPIALRAAYHAAREIFARFASEEAQSVALYGAVCGVDGDAVLLLGPTTIGKTVLGLHIACSGGALLGDETAMLSLGTDEIRAMPRRPSLRESALPLLPAHMAQGVAVCEQRFDTERGQFWYGLDRRALGGIEPSARPLRLRAVCVLTGRAESPSIQRIDVAEAVKAVTQRAYVRPTTLAQVGALRRSLRTSACFRMTLGEPRASSEMLIEAVRTCE